MLSTLMEGGIQLNMKKNLQTYREINKLFGQHELNWDTPNI